MGGEYSTTIGERVGFRVKEDILVGKGSGLS